MTLLHTYLRGDPGQGPAGAAGPAPSEVVTSRSLPKLHVSHEQVRHAARSVLRGNPAPGPDGVTPQALKAELERHIHQVTRQVRRGYRPRGLRRVLLASGRVVVIANIHDRVVSRLLLQQLHLFFAALPVALISRPGVAVRAAIASIAAERVGRWVIRCDIRSAFLSTSLDLALASFTRRASAAGVKPRVIDAVVAMVQPMRKVGTGVAPGHPLSNGLLDAYLADVDEALANAGVRHWRYADDYLLVARTEEEATRGLRLLSGLLAQKGLELHDEGSGKTHAARPDRSAEFLSWELTPDGVHRVSQAAVDDLIERLSVLPEEKAWRLLRGWKAHFDVEGSQSRMEQLDAWIAEHRPELSWEPSTRRRRRSRS